MPAVKKYFIAIVIPAPVMAAVESIKQGLFEAHGLKGALRSPAHITLHRPFEWRLDREAQLREQLRQFDFEPRFRIRLQGFGFFEPRVVYISVADQPDLVHLHRQLTTFAKRELRLFNEADDLRGFHPHVTVAFRDLKKPLFYELQRELEHQAFEAEFEVRGFSLLRLENTWKELEFFEQGE